MDKGHEPQQKSGAKLSRLQRQMFALRFGDQIRLAQQGQGQQADGERNAHGGNVRHHGQFRNGRFQGAQNIIIISSTVFFVASDTHNTIIPTGGFCVFGRFIVGRQRNGEERRLVLQ